MKRLLFILLLVCSSNTVFSQNDSIFPNYESVFCTTNSWNVIGETYTFPSDPYSYTLSVMFDDGNGFITYANLWLDNRKIWVKLIDPSNYVNTPYIIENFMPNDHNYPYEEFFLLYDFEHIDTIEIGDTVHNHYMPSYIGSKDTVLINGEEKILYSLHIFTNPYWPVDFWIEGYGSLKNPLYPLFYQDEIYEGMFCGCGMDVSYYDGTTVTYDSIKYGDLPFPYICDGYGNLESLVNEKVSIYPNPTKDKIEIKTSKNNQLMKIIISDIFGKVVQSETLINQGINELQLDLSHLTNGIYLIHVWTRDSAIKTLKIIKN